MTLLNACRENPFYVLAAAAGNSRTELIQKQEELALFGDDARADRALSKLLNPQTRTEAELHWFPLMDAQETQDLVHFFENHWDDAEMPAQSIPSVVAQFNMIRLALSRFQPQNAEEFKAILRSISAAADALIPIQVMDEINHDRRQAGFQEINSLSEIEPQIRDLLEETAKAYWETMSGRISAAEQLELARAFRADYKDASSIYHNSYFLEIAANQLDPDHKTEKDNKTIPFAPKKRENPDQFTKEFHFPRDKDISLKRLNIELAKMKLSNVDIRECKGFMFREETRNDHAVTSVRYGFGFDSITLDCEQKGDLYTWQIEAEVIPKTGDQEIDLIARNNAWRAKHADRVLRSSVLYTFDKADAIIMLYHNRN